MIPTGAGEAIGKAAEQDGNSVGPNGIITPGPPHEGTRVTPEGRIISVPPDVCLTPRGSAMVPVPYKIWAYQKEAIDLANTVLQTTLRSHVNGSKIRQCYGDEAGTGGGVKSGTTGAECTPKTWSKTESVRYAGFAAGRCQTISCTICRPFTCRSIGGSGGRRRRGCTDGRARRNGLRTGFVW